MNRLNYYERNSQRNKRNLFVIYLACFLGTNLIPFKISQGCTSEDYSFKGYSFLMNNIVSEKSTYFGYFASFGDFYQSFEEAAAIQEKNNIEEWQTIFFGIPRLTDIEKLVYSATISDLMSLQDAIEDEYKPLEGPLSSNSFARHLKNNKCAHTVGYLIFAKRCEPHVTRKDLWNPPAKDLEKMKYLIKRGKKEFKKSKSNYIRLRYAYQLIRLAHYIGDYEQTLKLIDDLLPQTDKVESILNYWILGHKAGALKKLGYRVEAAYLFSKIFQYAPGRRESAFRSFYIETDEEWKACLLKCETDKERAMLYALRANGDNSKAAEEMEQIYLLDPKNENLELLLAKEMKKLEKDFLGLGFNNHKEENKRNSNLPRKNAGAYMVKLHELVRKCIKENKVEHPELWMIADGYLEFLSNDLYAAERTFSKLMSTIKTPILQEQLAAFQLALKINLLDDPDEEDEDELVEIIRNDKSYQNFKDFPGFINDKLAFEYTKNDYPGKAFRCQHNMDELKPNPQLDILNDLLDICRKEAPSKFEKALVSDGDGGNIEYLLMDMKGTYYFVQDKPEAALEVLKRVPREHWDDYQENPFLERLQDCVDCPLPDSVAFNKVEIIEKIFELEYQAKADYKSSAVYFYQLGLAYYNMSYFGHAWKTMDYFRSGANWEYRKNNIFENWYFPYGNKENHDLTKSLFYFEKAIELANNPELAAKAVFMAAKCDQKAYFTSKDCTYYPSAQIPNLPQEYRRYYQLLKSRYNGTEFYQKIIEECKYFDTYTTR